MGSRKGKPGTMNSGLEATVGDQGTTGDDVELMGYWRRGTWIIPSVVGTVEDVVDNLKGGGGVLLVDGVQVRPRGDRDGRGGHFQTVSFNLRDCSNVRNSLLYG